MRQGDPRTIILPNGIKFETTYLGKGRHATAYRAGDLVYLFCKDDEYMKEVLVHCDEMPHLPPTEKLGDVVRRGKYQQVYTMPYSPTVTPKNREAWAILNTLKKAADGLFLRKYVHEKPLRVYGCDFNRDVINTTAGKVPETVTAALEELADTGCNYGCGVAFEFGKRNVGVDPEGRIVFRDILFDAEKLHREITTNRRFVY